MIKRLNQSHTGDSSREFFGVDDQAIMIFTWVVYSILCQIINIFGISTNVINIACFVSQGFKESVNISLLGLSISDLGSLATMIWTCICLTPAVIAADLPFDSMEVMYLTTVLPHFVFNRVSSCITAVITIERCLCITAPLKIKSIFTQNRVTAIIAFIFVASFCSATPIYTVNKLDMKFSPVKNKTIFGLVFLDGRENVEKMSFVINNFSIPLAAFVIIVVCTIVLSRKLHSNTKWRMKTTSQAQVDRVSSRNQKTAKMVVMISTLFIVCFIPVSIILLAVACVPTLSYEGKYINIGILIFGLGYIMEGLNSSMNIVIYYYMSSKYRDQFIKLFNRNAVKDKLMTQIKV